MRRALLFFSLLLLCLLANAQSDGQVKIMRTDGTTMIGTLQSADGTAVTIKIAGIEMAIPMSEVQSIEEYSPAPTPQSTGTTTVAAEEKLSDHYGDYIITDDNPEYPDSFTVEVNGKEVTMVLVRGGVFNMGYDDWNSRAMSGEPIHRVELSSYYISDDFVGQNMTYWDEAKKIVDEIAEEQGAPYRMVTEAEWEYAAIGPVQEIIFKKTYNQKTSRFIDFYTKTFEWCQDFWDYYSPIKQINPTGPQKGKRHVKRVYSTSCVKWFRVVSVVHKGHVRIAISADKIPNTVKESQ